MRPRRVAAEFAVYSEHYQTNLMCFNEAAASRRGILALECGYDPARSGFNEAAASRRGIPASDVGSFEVMTLQ